MQPGDVEVVELVQCHDVPIPLLGRDDMVTGWHGLEEQSNRRLVFADFRAERPENLYSKIATRLSDCPIFYNVR